MPSPLLIFDRHLLRARRARAAALGPSTFLIERAAQDLADRLATVLRRFDRVADLGTPTDAARRALAASGKVGVIIAADALQQARAGEASAPLGARELAVAADEDGRVGFLDRLVAEADVGHPEDVAIEGDRWLGPEPL